MLQQPVYKVGISSVCKLLILQLLLLYTSHMHFACVLIVVDTVHGIESLWLFRPFRAFSEEREGTDIVPGHAQRTGTATAPPGNRQENFGGPRQWDNRGGDRGGYNNFGGNTMG